MHTHTDGTEAQVRREWQLVAGGYLLSPWLSLLIRNVFCILASSAERPGGPWQIPGGVSRKRPSRPTTWAEWKTECSSRMCRRSELTGMSYSPLGLLSGFVFAFSLSVRQFIDVFPCFK